MVDTLVKSLGSLVRERRTLQRKGTAAGTTAASAREGPGPSAPGHRLSTHADQWWQGPVTAVEWGRQGWATEASQMPEV